MSTSEWHSKMCEIHVRIASGPLSVELLDHAFRVVTQGAGGLRARVPAGLYTLRYRAGGTMLEEHVTVVPGQPHIDLEKWMDFDSPVPVPGSRTSHEFHRYPAADATLTPTNVFGSGARLVVFVRSGGQSGSELVSVRGLVLRDGANRWREPLSKLQTRAGGDGWIAASLDVDPGGYVLEWHQDDGTSFAQPLWTSALWSTVVFISTDPVSGRPDPAQVSVHMVRRDVGFVANESEDSAMRASRALELILIGLHRGDGNVPADLLELLCATPFENPMLGIAGAHALVQHGRYSTRLLLRLIRTLEDLVPGHPDVIALRLVSKTERGLGSRTRLPAHSWPPMMRLGLEGAIARDWVEPGAIPPDSLVAAISGGLHRSTPWTRWTIPTADSLSPYTQLPGHWQIPNLGRWHRAVTRRFFANEGAPRSLTRPDGLSLPSAPGRLPKAGRDLLSTAHESATARIHGYIEGARGGADTTHVTFDQLRHLGLPVSTVMRAINEITGSPEGGEDRFAPTR